MHMVWSRIAVSVSRNTNKKNENAKQRNQLNTQRVFCIISLSVIISRPGSGSGTVTHSTCIKTLLVANECSIWIAANAAGWLAGMRLQTACIVSLRRSRADSVRETLQHRQHTRMNTHFVSTSPHSHCHTEPKQTNETQLMTATTFEIYSVAFFLISTHTIVNIQSLSLAFYLAQRKTEWMRSLCAFAVFISVHHSLSLFLSPKWNILIFFRLSFAMQRKLSLWSSFARDTVDANRQWIRMK